MKPNEIEDRPMYRLGRHWDTIQAYLIPGIEDDIGELGEDLKRFMQACELLINDEMFAKYRWCGNGRPPHSRISMFKAYILKAMRNYPYTTTLIAAIRESPTIRRLCGWESISEVPGVERVFGMLKDSHGGCTVRVRGNRKVFMHLMFGVLVIAAQKLIDLAQSIC